MALRVSVPFAVPIALPIVVCLAALLPAGRALAYTPAASLAKTNAWSRFETPSPADAEVIGGYANGCFTGGKALPKDGPGYQIVRRYRNRYYGHPRLLRYLSDYGERVKSAGLDVVLLGDLSQPHGGPMPYGHSSHQSGLDVDIWFYRPPAARQRPLTEKERDELRFPSFVDEEKETVRRDLWTPEHVQMLRLSVERPEVARVFVSAIIKKELCETAGDDREWLRKIRPWWAHDDHFHVRLTCPPGDEDCVNQAPVAAGDGCERVDWFLRARARARLKAAPKTKPRKRRRKQLPERCAAMVSTGDATTKLAEKKKRSWGVRTEHPQQGP